MWLPEPAALLEDRLVVVFSGSLALLLATEWLY